MVNYLPIGVISLFAIIEDGYHKPCHSFSNRRYSSHFDQSAGRRWNRTPVVLYCNTRPSINIFDDVENEDEVQDQDENCDGKRTFKLMILLLPSRSLLFPCDETYRSGIISNYESFVESHLPKGRHKFSMHSMKDIKL